MTSFYLFIISIQTILNSLFLWYFVTSVSPTIQEGNYMLHIKTFGFEIFMKK